MLIFFFYNLFLLFFFKLLVFVEKNIRSQGNYEPLDSNKSYVILG